MPARGARTGKSQLAVRPSAITLETGGTAAFPGRISHAAYLGDHIEYEAETSGGTLFIVDRRSTARLPWNARRIGLKNRGIAIIAQ